MSSDMREALRDVGAANTVATVVAVKAEEDARGLSAGQLVERLWENVPMPDGWTVKDLAKKTMPLATWAAVEWNLFRIFGNPQRAFEAITAKAATADFGGLELADWFRWLLRLFVPPSFVFAVLIPRLMPKFNTLKRATPVEADDNHVVYRVEYLDKTEKRTHEPSEDMGSRYWFEPAMTAGAAKYWFASAARVVHRVLELDLVQYLAHFGEFMPSVTFYKVNAEMRLRKIGDRPSANDQVVAKQVQLRPDDAGFYTVIANETDRRMGFDLRDGWQVEQAIEVLDPNGNTWQPLQQGTVFCARAGCSLTEYNWQPQTIALRMVFRFAVVAIGFLGGRFTGAARLTEAKTSLAELQAERDEALAVAERERALRVQIEQDHYPTRAIAEAVREGRFMPRSITGALLYFDLGDSTGFAERRPDAPMLMRQFMDAIDELMRSYLEGESADGVIGRTDSEPGDARMVAFSMRWNEGKLSVSDAEVTRREIKAAIVVATEIFAIFNRVLRVDGGPTCVRIGVHHGAFEFDRRGVRHGRTKIYGASTNLVARLEAAGKLPGVAAPDDRTLTMLASVAELVIDTYQFVSAGTHAFKGLRGQQQVVRLVLPGQLAMASLVVGDSDEMDLLISDEEEISALPEGALEPLT